MVPGMFLAMFRRSVALDQSDLVGVGVCFGVCIGLCVAEARGWGGGSNMRPYIHKFLTRHRQPYRV